MSQTRIMSIHRLLLRLLWAFCGGKALNGNVKHFVFDLTYNVIGDPDVVNICFSLDKFSRAVKQPLNFENRTSSYGVRREDMNRPPVGRVIEIPQ